MVEKFKPATITQEEWDERCQLMARLRKAQQLRDYKRDMVAIDKLNAEIKGWGKSK